MVFLLSAINAVCSRLKQQWLTVYLLSAAVNGVRICLMQQFNGVFAWCSCERCVFTSLSAVVNGESSKYSGLLCFLFNSDLALLGFLTYIIWLSLTVEHKVWVLLQAIYFLFPCVRMQ
jgi:hypothetical protein